jgi:hypothetical protein
VVEEREKERGIGLERGRGGTTILIIMAAGIRLLLI